MSLRACEAAISCAHKLLRDPVGRAVSAAFNSSFCHGSGMQRLSLQGTLIGARWAAALLPKPSSVLLKGLCHPNKPRRYQVFVSPKYCLESVLHQLVLLSFRDSAVQMHLHIKRHQSPEPAAGLYLVRMLNVAAAWTASGQQVPEKLLLSLKPP